MRRKNGHGRAIHTKVQKKPGKSKSFQVRYIVAGYDSAENIAYALHKVGLVRTDMHAHTVVVAVEEYNRRMKHYGHPFLKRHYGVYLFQRYAMERRHRIDAADDEGVDRPLHVNADVVMLACILEQQGHIQTVGAVGALVVCLVEGFYDAFGNHIRWVVLSAEKGLVLECTGWRERAGRGRMSGSSEELHAYNPQRSNKVYKNFEY